MSDLISRQAVLDKAYELDLIDTGNDIQVWVVDVAEVEALPPAEKKGKWTIGENMPPMKHRNGKPKKFWPSFKYCSCCGHETFDDSDWGEQLFDFCPYCGADMRGACT